MGKYVIITNIWGKNPKKGRNFKWNYDKSGYYDDYFESQKWEFDTKDELDEFISFFEDYCSTLPLPSKIKDNLKTKNYHPGFSRWREGERLWGYVYSDKESRVITWGGYKLRDYNVNSDKREILDLLLREPDEIPDNYLWDEGEYDGWLQFRWGDGKNAIGYEEPPKEKKNKIKIDEEMEEVNDDISYFESDVIDDSFAEKIEEAFAKKEERELIKKLEDR